MRDNNGNLYEENANLTIVITALNGYVISSITLNGSNVQITNPNTMSISHTVTGDITLEVTYQDNTSSGPSNPELPSTYTATITNDDSKGTISGIVNGNTYAQNVSLTILIAALNGFDISSITLNGSSVSITNVNEMSISHTVTSDITLVVEYVAETICI